jgi:hypothetical protein
MNSVAGVFGLCSLATLRVGAQAPAPAAVSPSQSLPVAPSSAVTPLPKGGMPRGRPRAVQGVVLSPLADTLSLLLVFEPVGQQWFTAASRGKRLLLDIGRLDADLKKDSTRKSAALEAVPSRTTVPVGTRFLLRGGWGREVAEVTGFDLWNGRVVATLKASAVADSLARAKETTSASAFRLDAAPVADTVPVIECGADTLLKSKEFSKRVSAVTDSLKRVVQGMVPRMTVYQLSKHQNSPSWKTSRVAGCFDGARVAVAVSLRGQNYEWVGERVVFVSPDKPVTAVKLNDLRFKGHELIGAYDADGDGTVDLVTRAVAEASGGTTILRYDAKAKKFERLTVGFQWEQR